MLGTALGLFSSALIAHLWWRAHWAESTWTGPFLHYLPMPSAVFVDLGLLFFFAFFHSALASLRVKKMLFSKTDFQQQRHFYLASTVFCSCFLWAGWHPLPAKILFEMPIGARIALHIIQGVGIAGFIWTLSSIRIFQFLGDEEIPKESGAETPDFSTTGPYALCRHPMYFFLLLMLCTPEWSMGRVLLAGAAVTYLVIGSRLEEKKNRELFGAAHLSYAKRVPFFLPNLRSLKQVLAPLAKASGASK